MPVICNEPLDRRKKSDLHPSFGLRQWHHHHRSNRLHTQHNTSFVHPPILTARTKYLSRMTSDEVYRIRATVQAKNRRFPSTGGNPETRIEAEGTNPCIQASKAAINARIYGTVKKITHDLTRFGSRPGGSSRQQLGSSPGTREF
jgi:hypothetical protein